MCKDGIGRYTCYCPELFQGYNCEIGKTLQHHYIYIYVHIDFLCYKSLVLTTFLNSAIPQLCEVNNGGCEHFCKVDQKKGTTVCSCAKGYNLADDRKACTSDSKRKTRIILNLHTIYPLYLVYIKINACFFFFILEPFKCGYVFPKATRSLLAFEPIQNVTNTANGTRLTSVKKGNLVITSANMTVTNYTQSRAKSNSLFGLIEPSPTVMELPELPESDGEKRIVNGEDCPPGECPWQVHTNSWRQIHKCF